MLYYQRKCETKITILLNFYKKLNVNFSLSLKIYFDSLTFLSAINFHISKFFTKNINVLENFSVSWSFRVNNFYFQNF